jgi:hypothetical protein
MADSAFRITAAEHPSIARTLRGKLETMRNQLVDTLANGYAQDWADYRHKVGIRIGLDHAIELCRDTEQDLTGDH